MGGADPVRGRDKQFEPCTVVPAIECVAVTELLALKDPRHACDAAVAARRKEIADLNEHRFADWAHTARIDEWERAESPGTWSRKMMLTSLKNAEKGIHDPCEIESSVFTRGHIFGHYR